MLFARPSLGWRGWSPPSIRSGPGIQMAEKPGVERSPRFYISRSGVDGMSLAMVILALLTLIAVMVSRRIRARRKALFRAGAAARIGDVRRLHRPRLVAVLRVFWEATLIPLFFLIDRLGGANRQKAALNFFLYTLGGSVFMLVALLFPLRRGARPASRWPTWPRADLDLPLAMQLLIFAGCSSVSASRCRFPLHRLAAAGLRRSASPSPSCSPGAAQDGRLRADPRCFERCPMRCWRCAGTGNCWL